VDSIEPQFLTFDLYENWVRVMTVPTAVDSAIRGLSIAEARLAGMLPPKGFLNIKGKGLPELIETWGKLKKTRKSSSDCNGPKS
jgi:hypothetical protein